MKIFENLTKTILYFFLVYHFVIVALYLSPDTNLVKHKNSDFIYSYMTPFFSQSWELFAPPSTSNKTLIYSYISYKGGVSDTLITDMTSILINNYKDKQSFVSDRVYYFLYRNMVGLSMLNNRLIELIEQDGELKHDSIRRSYFYQQRIKKSIFFSNLFNYSKRTFFGLSDQNKVNATDSTFLIISIIDRKIVPIGIRNNEDDYTTTVWNSPKVRLI